MSKMSVFSRGAGANAYVFFPKEYINLGQVASAPSQVAWRWPSAPAETKAEATPKPVLKITGSGQTAFGLSQGETNNHHG